MSEPLRGVVVAHGDLAAALVAAVEVITGDAAGLVALTNAGCDRDALRERVADALRVGPVVAFTDVAGGSCTVAAVSVARGRDDVRVVAGVNLPMLLEFAFHRDEPLAAAAEHAVATGRAAVREVGR